MVYDLEIVWARSTPALGRVSVRARTNPIHVSSPTYLLGSTIEKTMPDFHAA
jgi:hypothetical protein